MRRQVGRSPGDHLGIIGQGLEEGVLLGFDQPIQRLINQEELKYIFYGKNGYTVVNSASEIKGCYYHNDIEKCFNKQKEFKIWLQNKGAHWPK